MEEFKKKVLLDIDILELETSLPNAFLKTRRLYSFIYKYILENKIQFELDSASKLDLERFLDFETHISSGVCGFFSKNDFLLKRVWRRFWRKHFWSAYGIGYYRNNSIFLCHLLNNRIDELVVYLYYRIELLNKCIELTEKGE